MKIALATTNRGKIEEIRAVLALPEVTWVSVDDGDEWPTVEETGSTFKENACLKAAAVARHLDLPALADDSGLEVEALDGRPGINTARFAGSGATDSDNMTKLTSEVRARGLAGSKARFVCAIVLAWPDGKMVDAVGTCDGEVVLTPRGESGFGYDPIFIPESFDRTMAELSPQEKNRLSHRGRALRELRGRLEREGWIDD